MTVIFRRRGREVLALMIDKIGKHQNEVLSSDILMREQWLDYYAVMRSTEPAIPREYHRLSDALSAKYQTQVSVAARRVSV